MNAALNSVSLCRFACPLDSCEEAPVLLTVVVMNFMHVNNVGGAGAASTQTQTNTRRAGAGNSEM